VPRPQLRDQLLFHPGVYAWLLASNAALRLAWLHKLVPALRRSHGAVLGFALLEVFRC
jgi:EXS family